MSDRETGRCSDLAARAGAGLGGGDPAGAGETETAALQQRIADLEARLAALEDDRRFRTARSHALLTELRALIAEAEACPTRAAHHRLVERDAAGRLTKLEALYDDAFLAKAVEIGLANPRRFL